MGGEEGGDAILDQRRDEDLVSSFGWMITIPKHKPRHIFTCKWTPPIAQQPSFE